MPKRLTSPTKGLHPSKYDKAFLKMAKLDRLSNLFSIKQNVFKIIYWAETKRNELTNRLKCWLPKVISWDLRQQLFILFSPILLKNVYLFYIKLFAMFKCGTFIQLNNCSVALKGQHKIKWICLMFLSKSCL